VVFQSVLIKEINKEYPIYYASEGNMAESLKMYNIKKVKKGIIKGPEATVVNEALTSRIDIYALFVPIHKIPSLKGAASIIKVLNEIYSLNIETQKLIEKGNKIEKKYLEYHNKVEKQQNKKSLSEEFHSIYS
jgi:predicted ATP-grasp superfamily ATP-dependent carboligase